MNKIQKAVLGLGLIGSGITSAVLGGKCLSLSTGFSGSNETFGGDFYTYVHNKIVAVGNAVARAGNASKTGLGYLLIVIAIIAIILGIVCLLGLMSQDKIPEPTPAINIPISEQTPSIGIPASEEEEPENEELPEL